jgi:hypothetical protein
MGSTEWLPLFKSYVRTEPTLLVSVLQNQLTVNTLIAECEGSAQ